MPLKKKRPPGRPKSSTDGQAVRSTILSTASRLFMERGYENVSLDEIAAASGVTKASIYYYFDNKANLFTQGVLAMANNICSHIQVILDEDGTLEQKLIKVGINYLRVPKMDFESMLKESGSSLSEEQILMMRKELGKIHDLMGDTFQEAIDQGEISGNPLFLSHAFSALLMIGERGPNYGPFTTVEEAAEEIVRFFWNGACRPRKH